MRHLAFASVLIFGLAACGTPAARAQTDKVQTYKLEPASAFETGCFAICECPIFTHPLRGTFFLQHTGVDPLFDYYQVSDVRWVVTDATTYFEITGSGTYKIGGEFALQHQLALDLSLNGGPPRHFDSGLIVGGSQFPRIVIDVSLHQNSACIDTVIHVDATDPVTTAVEATANGLRAPWVRSAPNPFRGQTEFRVAVPRASPVDVIIFDAAGRMVRHLRNAWLSPGVHTLPWDGLRDQGSRCPPGVYFAAARVGAERVTSRIVKLD